VHAASSLGMLKEWHAEHLDDGNETVLMVSRFYNEHDEIKWTEHTDRVLTYPHILTNGPCLHLEQGVSQKVLDILKARHNHVEKEPVFQFFMKVGRTYPLFRPTIL
jgi:hypothetical protein